MAHSVERFSAANVYNKPHLIQLQDLKSICGYIEKRSDSFAWRESLEASAMEANKQAVENKTMMFGDCSDPAEDKFYTVENGVAFIDIQGTLTYKPTIFSMLCGGCSYVQLQDAAKEIAEDVSISHVVLNVSSGGGQAYGAFTAAKYMHDTLKGSNKKIITYVDGMMASAAYALGCIADEVIVNPDAQVGSIGVVIALHDEHIKEQMEGEKTIYITAGDSKVPFAEDGSFKKEFLDDLQKDVDYTYGKFTAHVAAMRNISEESVIATQAKVYKSPDAIKLGLADKEMTTFEFEEYLSGLVNGEIELEQKPEIEQEEPEEDSGCGKKKKKMSTETIVVQESSSVDTQTINLTQGDNLDEVHNSHESQEALSVEQLTVDPAIAEQLAELAQLKEMKAQMDQILQEKAELEAAAKAQEMAELKANYLNMVQSLGFVAEDKVEAVAEATFKLRETLGEEASLIIDQLAAARDVIENMKSHMTVEIGADAEEVEVELSEQDRAAKSLDAKIAEKYGVK